MLLGLFLATMPEPLASEVLPVTPGTSFEARQLLKFLYERNGGKTLTGQHNQLHVMSKPSEDVEKLTGKYPLVWGGEWGFSDERHDIDNIKYRPKLVEQIREQHKAGRIICLTYHQASPTVGEPCDFKGGVQVKISDAEWDAILTEGTLLNKVWAEHVDRLAEAFKTLEKEKIPIIFRPYHEMNGGWFWWGGQPERFQRLWAMIYDRYTKKHGLKNLLWAWNPDKPYPGVEKFFPGLDKVDLLGTDIYPTRDRKETYPQEWYDRMKGLAGDKPLALSEMSELPTEETLAAQPWAYFMSWGEMLFRANPPERIKAVYASPKVSSHRLMRASR
jgi:mannan endo-1,4-beta-mannosidase